MTFNGKEYDDMGGWKKVLEFVLLPLFVLLQIVPNKEGKTEFAIIIGFILAVVIAICFLLANIISPI